jgi:ribulose-5-phosphate 4-epimerase/fuculose-1-phosphate aldolase
MLDEMDIREKLVYFARLAYHRRLVRGTGGNLSARLNDNEMIITASGLSLGDTEIENLISVNINSYEWIENRELKPSKEYKFHADILRLRTRVGAVLHVHPPYATAYSALGRDIPRITDAGLKQPAMPRVPFAPGGSDKLLEQINLATVENPECKALILEKHGVVAMGVDIGQAFYLADLIEELAHIAFIAENLRE